MSDLPEPTDELEPDPPESDETDDLEPEVEVEAPEDAGAVEAEPERPSRRERGRAIDEQLRQIHERNERLERELTELRSRPQPAVDPQAAQREEQEFYASLEMLSPAEAIRAAVNRERQLMTRTLGYQQFTTQDTLDRNAYEAKTLSSRPHQQYRPRVEEMVASERARGNVVSRETVLEVLVGRDTLSRMAKAAPRQRQEAAARVAAQRTQPLNSRSEAPRATGRAQPGSLEHDLEIVNAAIARGETVF